ncbi:MAG TPA: aldehyde dehydrogenase family protein [Rhodobacteraceae bacterium]|nr:aldehyde dehydrogenase family protein [Paracoccaceae bacterium]
MSDYKLYIGGKWLNSLSGQSLDVIDPADGSVFAGLARGQAEDIDQAVLAARHALDGEWGALTAMERGRLLMKLTGLVLEHSEELAALESRDVGKPLREARADVAACARYFEYYAGACDKVHGTSIPFQNGYTIFTLREPHGVTAHIIPWNYPLQILGRSIGGALAMGNACVLKPAEDASLSSLKIAELAETAGFPPGSLNVVTGLGSEAGAALAGHPGVQHVSFTGSPQTGALVQQAAAAIPAPVTLELGGKSPQVVFEDADLDAAEASVMKTIIQNAGQTCSAGSRVLVQQTIYEPFIERLADRFRKLVAGPGDRDPDCGPLVNRTQQQRVLAYLEQARRDGLNIRAQGQLAPNLPPDGFYVRPTLIGEVPPQHALAQEEIFGPVLVAGAFADEAEAVKLANGTPYGLVAGVWTSDGARQMRLARAIHAGQVFINNFGAGGGVELPFGGVGRSGHGREKGFEALYGFSVAKTIAIQHG